MLVSPVTFHGALLSPCSGWKLTYVAGFLEMCHPRCVRSVIQCCSVYISIYIHTVMSTTILLLLTIYRIQLHVAALYVGHHQVVQRIIYCILTFCWPCILIYLSKYLTNLIHKICFRISFISYLYMFRAHVLIIKRSKLHYTASGIITHVGVMIPEAA